MDLKKNRNTILDFIRVLRHTFLQLFTDPVCSENAKFYKKCKKALAP